jgi:glycosyltransferase involved in cell wall biosynthesis
MRVAFVTNLPSHYHKPLFEALAQAFDTDFYFFSDGSEKWIENKNSLNFGNYKAQYVCGWRISSRFRLNIPLLYHIYKGRYDVVIQAISGRFETPSIFFLCRILGTPFVLWANLWQHPGGLFHNLTSWMVKYIYKASHAIVAYGPHVASYIKQYGVSPRKIFYSWNITDNHLFNRPVLEHEKADVKRRLDLGAHSLLYVGRLVEEKGLRILFEAYKHLVRSMNVSLVCVGRGPLKEELEQYVVTNHLDKVRFLDYVPNEELAAIYSVVDVLVLPSVTRPWFKEPWGIVVNESMNQGCAIIATTAVGAALSGLVVEGLNGYVVPEEDVESLRGAMEKMFISPERLAAMKEFSRTYIQQWDYRKSLEGFRNAIAYLEEINK